MIVTLARPVALHVAFAVRAHVRRLEHDGMAVPPELAGLADKLLASVTASVTEERNRALAAARSRRYRARQRERAAA